MLTFLFSWNSYSETTFFSLDPATFTLHSHYIDETQENYSYLFSVTSTTLNTMGTFDIVSVKRFTPTLSQNEIKAQWPARNFADLPFTTVSFEFMTYSPLDNYSLKNLSIRLQTAGVRAHCYDANGGALNAYIDGPLFDVNLTAAFTNYGVVYLFCDFYEYDIFAPLSLTISDIKLNLNNPIPDPQQISSLDPINTADSCPKIPSNSYINADTLSLHENIPLIGIASDLYYSSERLRANFPFNPKSLGLGGWTLGMNHHYDSSSKRIFFGDGSNANVQALQSADGLSYVASASGSELYYFDASGKHLITRDALTGVKVYSFNYDNSGRLLSITDQFQKSISISYLDSSHAQIISKYGQVHDLNFDSNGFLASVKNPNNELFQIQNTSQGFLSAFTKPKGQTSYVDYDSNGYVLKDTGAGGDFVSLIRSFDADSKTQSVVMSTALNRQTQYITSTPEAGKSTHKVILPDGSSSDSSNHEQGPSSSVNSSGIFSSSNKAQDPRFGWMSPYNSSSSLSVANSQIRVSSSVSKSVDLSNSNDPFSYSKMTTKTVLQNDPLKTYTTEFDKASRTYSSLSPMGRKSLMQLNELNLLSSMKTGNLESVLMSYDDFGRITQIKQGSRITSISYDQAGNINKVIDPLGKETRYISDLSGRVIEQIRPDQKSVKFNYDANGNMISITPPEKPVHSFSYNLFDLMQAYTPPALVGNVSTQYSYNLDKQLTKIQRPDGKNIDFVYNQSSSNLESIQNEKGTYSFVYNNPSGLLKSVSSPDGVKNSFDYLGNVLSSSQLEYANLNVKLNLSYNNDLSLSSSSLVAQNSVSNISYLFDNDNLPVKIGDQTLGYDAVNGLLVNTSLDKVTENISRNNFGEIASSQYKFTGAVNSGREYYCKSKSDIFSYSLVRDNAGRIIAKSEKERHERLENAYYYYDQIGRLVGVKDGKNSRYYYYDANGNRLKKVEGKEVIQAQYDAQDRLIKYGDIEYSYNANGDLVSKIEAKDHGNHYGHFKHHWFQKHDLRNKKKLQTQYFYDSFGNLNKVILPNNDVVEYIIDGQNRRVGKKLNGKLLQMFVYQSQTQIAAELDGQGNLIRRYIYGSKINVPDYFTQNGVKYKIITDHLGSPRLIVNASSGKIIDEMNFDEFGMLEKDYDREDHDNIEIPFGFAGGLYDEHTGLVRFGARDYDPTIGRWTSKDPIGFGGGDPNLYGYVKENPLSFVDPTGLKISFLDKESEKLFNALFGNSNLSSLDKKMIEKLSRSDKFDVKIKIGKCERNDARGSATKVNGGADVIIKQSDTDYFNQSILLHELVHSFQIYNGFLPGLDVSEEEAYQIQRDFLRRGGIINDNITIH